MKIIGFLQQYNNVKNGFLRVCLESLSRISDEIYVYDDGSTEDVWPLYREYNCIVIPGLTNEFHRELYHKQQLLRSVLRDRPDWIVWHDTDAILGRDFETREGTEEILNLTHQQGVHLLHLHNLNLYRSYHTYRTDSQYNDLWHGVFWKNTGELHYKPIARLHQKQYPFFFKEQQGVASRFPSENGQLLHLGFATDEEVIRKYLKYKEEGQSGPALDRLADETGLTLEPANPEWFPTWFEMPEYKDIVALDFERLTKFNSVEEWEQEGCPIWKL